MTQLRWVWARAVLVTVGLLPVLFTGACRSENGPLFFPPFDQFLSPTLLDVLLWPGITG